ncbi:MAG: SDR family NAD(P)-dependent oxidoreductase, partial [Rhodospirillales bacterium]|nr:SDR family NAD(P)-dependent oxidoreductase [Rhodospirillales bacterium]
MSDNSPQNLGNLFESQPLKGQHALITGGSRGIGAATSNALAALGASITLLARDAGRLKQQ